MNLDDEQESSNIVDRRGERGGGGGMRLPIGGGMLGIGGMIVVGVIALLLGQNPLAMIGMVEGGVNSGCGQADSGMGPFYCPADQQVHLDASFFDDLSRRFGAPGDFAAAYVIAHEVGHHIQTVIGISAEVQKARRASGPAQGNALSVRQELQADCFAGVWAHHNRDLLEPGDIEEGLRAAQAIGDDTLQQKAGARVNPESFTHGTSAQRMRWLQAGLQSGQMNSCDTFAARRL